MSESITVKSIVEDYLKANGYDGLWSEWSECGCFVGELMCCGVFCDGSCDDCHPGYKVLLEDGDIGIGPKGAENA